MIQLINHITNDNIITLGLKELFIENNNQILSNFSQNDFSYLS